MKNIATSILLVLSLILASCQKDSGNSEPITNPKVNTSTTEVTLPSSATGNGTFSITADHAWTISLSDTKATPSWCKVSPMSGSAGTTTISITTLEENSFYEDRNAYIKIASGKTTNILTVTQKKKNAILLTKDKIEIGEAGGQIQIELNTNVDYTVEIPQQYSTWLSKAASNDTKGLIKKTEVFNVKEGDTEGARYGIIVFMSNDLKDTVHVYQTQKNALILTQREYNCSSDASNIEVELRSNVEYGVTISASATWIKRVESKASKIDKLTFSIDKNAEYDFRSASIIIKDKNSSLADTLVVRQSQHNAFILGENRIEDLSYIGGTVPVRIKSNVSLTCEIPAEVSQWLSILTTKGLKDTCINFVTSRNNGFSRETKVVIRGSGEIKDTLYIKQEGVKELLMELFNSTNGDSWKNKTNWGSTLPINEWYGIDVSGDKIYLQLYNNNLSGYIPESIGRLKDLASINLFGNNIGGDFESLINNISELTELLRIDLRSNKLTGQIPTTIGNFNKLECLDLGWNNLSGTIPESICKLTKLNTLRLHNNTLNGVIPEEIGKLPLVDLSLNYNKLTGPLPTSLLTMSNWQSLMDYVINQDSYTIYPPLAYAKVPDKVNKDFKMRPFNAYEVISAYKYTILYSYDYDCVWSNIYTPTVVNLVEQYRSKGLGAISYHAYIPSETGKLDKIKEYVKQKKMDKFVNLLHIGTYIDEIGSTQWDDSYFFGSLGTPSVMVLNRDGALVFGQSEIRDKLPEFISSVLGAPDITYESTDYSKDGTTVTLQRASQGDGINLVILGDGFVDRDMATGGKYETWAREAMEAFFEVEPVKSFRNRFNVYCVKAVSKHEGIGSFKESVFSTQYGDGTLIGGDNIKCKQYALKVPSISDLSNTAVLTILNDPKYAGTCYMYADNSSISYCPYVGYDKEQFAQIIHHEAVGHGFGKLADEYSYNGRVKASEVKSYRADYYENQWWSNIDFTNDVQKVKWSSFLNDILYSTTVGIHEGGATYMYGVYRPTENSIMRYNTGDFNAPSRLEIYRRIIELSGETYSYDNFIKYDALNRITTKAPYAPPVHFVPLAPPVIVR